MSDPRTTPRFSEQLWSEEVGMAEAFDPPGAAVGYRFSSGRAFAPAAYDPAPPSPPIAALVAVVVSRQRNVASTFASSALSLDAAATTGQGQRSEVFMGDDGTAYAAMGQAQGALASAAVGIDALVAASQGQTVLAFAGAPGNAFAVTRQGQSGSAEAGLAVAVSMATGQGQHHAALVGVGIDMAVGTGQGQRSAARAEQGPMLVAAKQAQRVAAVAALGVDMQGAASQGQQAGAAAAAGVAAQLATRQGQRSGAHAGGDGDAFVVSRQGQRSAAVASAAIGSQVSTRQAQRVAAVLLKGVTATVATRQGQRAALVATPVSSGGAALAQRQSVVAAAAASNGIVAGATIYVALTGSDSNSGTASAPLRTIQRAATRAVAGDVVSVAPGTYAEYIVASNDGTANSRIRFVSAVQWGAKIVPPAVNSRIFAFQHNGDYVTIDGFEVDGTVNPTTGTPWRCGIGVYGSGAIVTRCHVHHIYRTGPATSNGGSGILLEGSDGGINQKALANRTHHIGLASGGNGFHGIYITAPAEVRNNVTFANTGAGLHCWHDVHDVVIANNTTFGNATWGIVYGGGDYALGSGPADFITVVNNIVYGNDTGIEELGDLGSHNVIKYNQVTGNGVNYRLVVTSHTNDIVGGPAFVNYQADGSGDYHLTAASPGVAAALATFAPADDFDGHARPVGGAFDLGAYEYGSS